MKHEIVLKNETPRSESTQAIAGEEQRTSANNIASSDTTRPTQDGCLKANVHKGKRKV